MKNLILSTVLGLLCLRALPQSFYLKLSEHEAVSAITRDMGERVNFQKSQIQNGKLSIGWDNGYSRCFLYFDEEGVSEMYCIAPKTRNTLNMLIKIFNKDDIKVSDTHWKVYDKGTTYDIHLDFVNAENKYAFYIAASGDQ